MQVYDGIYDPGSTIYGFKIYNLRYTMYDVCKYLYWYQNLFLFDVYDMLITLASDMRLLCSLLYSLLCRHGIFVLYCMVWYGMVWYGMSMYGRTDERTNGRRCITPVTVTGMLAEIGREGGREPPYNYQKKQKIEYRIEE